jgi:hypothetical protein
LAFLLCKIKGFAGMSAAGSIAGRQEIKIIIKPFKQNIGPKCWSLNRACVRKHLIKSVQQIHTEAVHQIMHKQFCWHNHYHNGCDEVTSSHAASTMLATKIVCFHTLPVKGC